MDNFSRFSELDDDISFPLKIKCKLGIIFFDMQVCLQYLVINWEKVLSSLITISVFPDFILSKMTLISGIYALFCEYKKYFDLYIILI